ncbi:hypothetical protein ACIA5D_08705 [Actinoplanes sp. NPDC051513]|uniref:hypothetical protein n=1 Tax=Actinoplanes sp. NPDC051513 TaxID=3363908 RepID=UPI0037A5DD0F
MSFDLWVLATDGRIDRAEVAAMVGRCEGGNHVEGELDERVVGFYEKLRARFPDHPPFGNLDESPWMSTPLGVGIDHVSMCLSYSERSNPAIGLIWELATEYGLTIWDPQDETAHRPVAGPSRETVAAWWRDLLDGRCGPEETHERVRPWVEETPEAVDDPITAMGIQQLYGASGSTRALFGTWLAHGERYDADPDGWIRDRHLQAVQAVRRDQGPDRAQALALQLVARGELSTDDVAGVPGPTA